MILDAKDLSGSILDKPEYMQGFQENRQKFLSEWEDLKKLDPKNPKWNGALYSFNIYRDVDGYRIAIPVKYLPFKIDNRIYFEDFMLSNVVFPNQYQALRIAARMVDEFIGH